MHSQGRLGPIMRTTTTSQALPLLLLDGISSRDGSEGRRARDGRDENYLTTIA